MKFMKELQLVVATLSFIHRKEAWKAAGEFLVCIFFHWKMRIEQWHTRAYTSCHKYMSVGLYGKESIVQLCHITDSLHEIKILAGIAPKIQSSELR